MKRMLLFAVSFVIFYFVVQIGMGFMMTWMYQPDIATVWNQSSRLPSEISFGSSNGRFPWISFLIALVLAAGVTRLSRKKRA